MRDFFPRRTLAGWIGLLIGYPIARIAGFLYPLNILCVYVWTAVIGYHMAGVVGALLASAMPVVAQANIIWMAHRDSGDWVSQYSVTVACIPATWLVSVLGAWLLVRGEEAERAAAEFLQADEPVTVERAHSAHG